MQINPFPIWHPPLASSFSEISDWFRTNGQLIHQILEKKQEPSEAFKLKISELHLKAQQTFAFCKPDFLKNLLEHKIEATPDLLKEAEITCHLFLLNYIAHPKKVLEEFIDFGQRGHGPNANAFLFLLFKFFLKEPGRSSYISLSFPLLENPFIQLLKDFAFKGLDLAASFKFLNNHFTFELISVLNLRLSLNTKQKLFFDIRPIDTSALVEQYEKIDLRMQHYHTSPYPLNPVERFRMDQSLSTLHLAFRAWMKHIKETPPNSLDEQQISLGFKTYNLSLEELPIGKSSFLTSVFSQKISLNKDELLFCLDFAGFYFDHFRNGFIDALTHSKHTNYLKTAFLLPLLSINLTVKLLDIQHEGALEVQSQLESLLTKWMPLYISLPLMEIFSSLFQSSPDSLGILDAIRKLSSEIQMAKPFIFLKEKIVFDEQAFLNYFTKNSIHNIPTLEINFTPDGILCLSTKKNISSLADSSFFNQFPKNFYLAIFNHQDFIARLPRRDLSALVSVFEEVFINSSYTIPQCIADLQSYRVVVEMIKTGLPVDKIDYSPKPMDLSLKINSLIYNLDEDKELFNIRFLEMLYRLTDDDLRVLSTHFLKTKHAGKLIEFISFFPLEYFHLSKQPFIKLLFDYLFSHGLSKIEAPRLIEGLSYLPLEHDLCKVYPSAKVLPQLRTMPGQYYFISQGSNSQYQIYSYISKEGKLIEDREAEFNLSLLWSFPQSVYHLTYNPNLNGKTIVAGVDLSPQEFCDLFGPAIKNLYIQNLLRVINFLFPESKIPSLKKFVRNNWEFFNDYQKSYTVRILLFLALNFQSNTTTSSFLNKMTEDFGYASAIANYAKDFLSKIFSNPPPSWTEESPIPAKTKEKAKKAPRSHIDKIMNELEELVIPDSKKELYFRLADNLFKNLDSNIFRIGSKQYELQLAEIKNKFQFQLFPSQDLIRTLWRFLNENKTSSHYALSLVKKVIKYFQVSPVDDSFYTGIKLSKVVKKYYKSHEMAPPLPDTPKSTVLGILNKNESTPFFTLDCSPPSRDVIKRILPSLFSLRIKEFRSYTSMAIQAFEKTNTTKSSPLLFISKKEDLFEIIMLEARFQNGILKNLKTEISELHNPLGPTYKGMSNIFILSQEQMEALIETWDKQPDFYLINLEPTVSNFDQTDIASYRKEQSLTENFIRGSKGKRKIDQNSDIEPAAKKRRLSDSSSEKIPAENSTTNQQPLLETDNTAPKLYSFWEDESRLTIRSIKSKLTEHKQ